MKSQTLCGGAVCGLPTRGKAQGCRAPHSTVASWPTSVAHEWQVPALPIGVGFRAGQRVTLKALPDPERTSDVMNWLPESRHATWLVGESLEHTQAIHPHHLA